MSGLLHAWRVEHESGRERPAWFALCRRFGDFLLAAQSRNGSFARRCNFDGSVADPATSGTDQPIPFLIDLAHATGDCRYRAVALRAAEYCWQHVHLPYAYAGGMPDNLSVLDKEGGMEALAVFESLYDATQDRRWLQAAGQAADLCKAWTYCWSVPVSADDPRAQYPAVRSTLGLIAADHSGCDDYMAAAPYLFDKLARSAGGARLVLYGTKQMLDLDDSLHYAHPGLLTEVLTLASPSGHGVPVWLPRITVNVLQPMVDLRQADGSYSLDGKQ